MTNRLTHLMQKPNSTNCGQTCVAMITESNVGTIERIMGTCKRPKKGGTRTVDLVGCLKVLGFNPSKKLTRLKNPWDDAQDLPLLEDGCYILKMTFTEKTNHGHWIVYKDGWIYDPGQKSPFPFFHYRKFIEHYFRPTSYLKILKEE